MVARIDGDIHKYIKKNTREILQNVNVIYSYYNIYSDIYIYIYNTTLFVELIV